jgi:hypothetical protein
LDTQIRNTHKRRHKILAIISGLTTLVFIFAAILVFAIGLPQKWYWLEGQLTGHKTFQVEIDRRDIVGDMARHGILNQIFPLDNNQSITIIQTSEPPFLWNGKGETSPTSTNAATPPTPRSPTPKVTFELYWGTGSGWFLSIFTLLPILLSTCCVGITTTKNFEEIGAESLKSQIQKISTVAAERRRIIQEEARRESDRDVSRLLAPPSPGPAIQRIEASE